MLRLSLPFLILMLATCLSAQEEKDLPSIEDKTESLQAYEGFFDFYWDEKAGKIWLEIDKFQAEFLYVNSLTAAIGSNDIGLDRNQLGQSRVVYFERVGPRVLLIQPNYDYRAESDNPDEQQAVADAFARSVLAGFEIKAENGSAVLVDLTPLLMEDAHGVANRLKRSGQGTYKLDKDRSALYLPRTKNFLQNSEFEVMLTFAGDPEGRYIREVTPSPQAVSVRQHHSFVQLPDDGYEPRVFDPRCGFFGISYQDYATPIDQPLTRRFIQRHRLQKEDPNAEMSQAVEPIVYYLDRGAPEPIRSALLEGARWWNQAFEAAGYENAFQVELLPEDADPMDVRYNLINWTHRATRGWSYGSSVTDPRTGEIIKGHVLLGSLRVRQDFLIAQGLIQAYEAGEEADPRLLEMALARLRQLSAHEVGHTLGLAHNFAASYNNRASVMDYPHPLVKLNPDGSLDFSDAYDTGIGAWDKRTILYGYQDFPEGTDEEQALVDILTENNQRGLRYLSDEAARPAGSAHPIAHLWDNGREPLEELDRLSRLRQTALARFGQANIPPGSPLANLERVLVPLYYMHRYQVEAVSKLIGGVNYSYAVQGDIPPIVRPVDDPTQSRAMEGLFATLDPDFLAFPNSKTQLIPPQPMGFGRDRELFKTYDDLSIDPIAAAESSANHTLTYLLNAQRLARLQLQSALEPNRLSPSRLIDRLWRHANQNTESSSGYYQHISMMVEKRIVHHLMLLAANTESGEQVAAVAMRKLQSLESLMRSGLGTSNEELAAHRLYLQKKIQQFMEDPKDFKFPTVRSLPPGSPIGCGE